MATKARPRHPGSSYRLTLRTSERRYFLTPTEEAVELVGFALAVAADHAGIRLHSVEVLNNHLHADLTDPGVLRTCTDPNNAEGLVLTAAIADFLCHFESLVARAGNCMLGRSESFWAPGYGLIEVETAEAAAAGMVYTFCNVVEAGLVASLRAWPGLRTLPEDLPTRGPVEFRTFKKPKKFFRTVADGGALPDEVTLVLWPHPLGVADPEGFKRGIIEAVKRRVKAKCAEVRKAGGRFRGAAAVVAQAWNASPKTKERRHTLNPTVAEPNTARRVLQLARNAWFQTRYTRAMRQWKRTGRAVFPAGTQQMRSMPGVTVESSGSRLRSLSLIALWRC